MWFFESVPNTGKRYAFYEFTIETAKLWNSLSSSSSLDRSVRPLFFPVEKMVMNIVEPNTCIRGCCTSESIPLHLSSSSFTLLSPIAKGTVSYLPLSPSKICVQLNSICLENFSGSESVVYEAILDSRKVAAKKPILSTSDDLDKFHRHLQLLWSLSLFVQFYFLT